MPRLKKPIPTPPPVERPQVPLLTVSVADAAIATNLSKSSLYTYMRNGELKYIKAGARRLVAISELESFLARLSNSPEAA